MSTRYVYRGDRWTDPALKGQRCEAVHRPDGRCIRGRNGSMLVAFAGRRVVVIGRQLRKMLASPPRRAARQNARPAGV